MLWADDADVGRSGVSVDQGGLGQSDEKKLGLSLAESWLLESTLKVEVSNDNND